MDPKLFCMNLYPPTVTEIIFQNQVFMLSQWSIQFFLVVNLLITLREARGFNLFSLNPHF